MNTGNVTLTDVTVTDPLVAVVGGPITLAPGATDTTTFTATYAITQVDIDNGNVTNQATAEGTTPAGDTVTDLSDDDVLTEDDPTVTELCQNGSIALIKFGEIPPNPFNGTGCPVPGDIIEYTFTVVNTGNVSLSNVMITDPLVAVIGGPITLAAGATVTSTFTATYVITQADVDAGEVVNQATVEGTTPAGDIVSDLSDNDVITEDDPTVVEICQNLFIGLVKVGTFNDANGDGCANVNETITYTFTVYNLGSATLQNITINDPLVNVVGGPITLAPQTSDATSFTAVYPITQIDIDNGFVENQAIVSGFTLLGQQVQDLSDDNSEFEDDPTITPLCQGASIALIKTGRLSNDQNGNGCIDLGDEITYDFFVYNTGNVELTNIHITDPLPGLVLSGGPITLAAGASDSVEFSGVYIVTQGDIDAGNVTNQATVFGTPAIGTEVSDLSDDDSILENDPTVIAACNSESIYVEKSGVWNDTNGDGAAQAGETISYRFTIENTGLVTLFNITLDDPLLGGLIPGPDSGDDNSNNNLDVDETWVYTAVYTITQADVDAGEVINQALGSSTDINGNTVEDQSDDPQILTNVDPNGDNNPDDPTVTILPGVGPGQFIIFNGITPDGDDKNDFFEIRGIQDYGTNNVQIFNRWGVLVFETDNYGGSNGEENVFRGISEGRVTVRENEELPTGTYYYILRFTGELRSTDQVNPGKDSYAGYLYINR